MPPAAALEIRGVSKVFGQGADKVTALAGVDLTIAENEFFTLLGPSGCGKTTLLRLIAGFEQPSSGEVLLRGQPMSHLPPFRRPVNTVFQSYALFPHMSVAQNIAFGLEMRRQDVAVVTARVAQMLALVRLEDFANRMPAQLSGGQQQRVALARALASEPQVLLLDEPLSALDLKLRRGMQLELKRLQSETGITFIFVTHDQEEALTMSDRIAVMSDGHVLQVGSPEAIYERPERRFVADFIGETNFIQATALGGGRYRIAEGHEVALAGMHAEGTVVTLAVRPERLTLADDGLPGTLDQIVYLGTDTIGFVRLAAGPAVQIRLQNTAGRPAHLDAGAAVKVHMPPEALRVLAD